MDQLENKVYVDGFIALAKDWRFLCQPSTVAFPRSFGISMLQWTSFKGITALKGKSIRGIKLFQLNGTNIHMLMTHGTEAQQIEYGTVFAAFSAAIEYTMLKIDGTETHRKWFGRPRRIKRQDNSFEVYAEDLVAFGTVFQTKFERKLHGWDVYLCAMRMGQKSPVDTELEKLNSFRLDYAEELVIHFARDFNQRNKCLLWNREKVCDTLNTAPSKEYYVGFTGRVGNFEMEVETDVDGLGAGDAVPCNIKLYSSAFKDLHRNNPAPFKECRVASLLANTTRLENEENYIFDSLEMVEDAITWTEKVQLVEARIEVIFWVENPEAESLAWAQDAFNRDYGEDTHRMLDQLDAKEFIENIRDTLGVTVRTLTGVMQEFVQNKAANVGHFVSTETLHLASACEMLICYGIYGKLHFRQTSYKRRFNTDLINQLRLQKSTFRNMASRFTKFDFTNGVIESLGDVIVYKGQLVLTSFVYGDLAGLLDKRLVQNLNFALCALNADSDMARSEPSYEEVFKVLWESIVKHSLKTMYRSRIPANGFAVDQLEMRLRESNFEPISSREFARWILSPVSPLQRSIREIVSALRNILEPRNQMAEFGDRFAKYMESKLYETTQGILYPITEDDYYLVLPLFWVNNCSFSNLSADKQEVMVNMYQMAYRKMFMDGIGQAPNPRQMFDKVEQLGWGRAKPEEVRRALGYMWKFENKDMLREPMEELRPMSAADSKTLLQLLLLNPDNE
ncbi:unnamed protein product [Orchesella dallaii]|uniref:Uncharacterized protein n=1 Tax=Orchesella dallaii TaxID=48710 RepID=A0ABP1S0W5_9HEXA